MAQSKVTGKRLEVEYHSQFPHINNGALTVLDNTGSSQSPYPANIVNPRTKGIQEVIRLTASFSVEMLHLASSRAEELAAAVALLDEDHARQEMILGRLVNPSPNRDLR